MNTLVLDGRQTILLAILVLFLGKLLTSRIAFLRNYNIERNSRSLFYSTDVETLRAQYPDHPALHTLSAETRLVVSEPLGDLAGVWNEVPESSCGIVQQGQDELRPFTPRSA